MTTTVDYSGPPFRVYLDPALIGQDGYPYAWHSESLDAISQTLYPPIKDLIRERDGHRCLRCGHPYHGSGQWSPCDDRCTHHGPVRSREIYRGDGEWSYHDLDRVGAAAGEVLHDEGPGGVRMLRWEQEAEWRILTVHHLNGIKHDCRWWNLVSLCQRCHLTIQGKVYMDRPYDRPHSEWFRIFAAAFYAWKYLDLELSIEETAARLDELLALEQRQDALWP